jgi:putative transposase
MQKDYSKLPILNELSTEQRNIALNKYYIIQPFLQKTKALTTICKESKLSLRTVSSWVKHYRQNGFIGLVRKIRNDSGIRRCCSKKLQSLIEGIYLKTPHLSMTNIYKKIKEYAIEYNLSYPSYRTCCIIIKEIPKDLSILAHEGSKKYKEKYDLLYMRETSSSNEVWQADHALLDIWIKDHANIKRPWLTIVFDDYSRSIAGYQLSFLAPSAIKTALAIRQAIWHKKEYNWYICGIPTILYTDHGSDFTSKHIEQVCLDLKIKLIFSQVGQPRGRGKIERFFLTLNQMCLSLLDGYLGSDKKIIPKLTLGELDELLKNFIIEYNNRFQKKYNCTPQECWQQGGFIPNIPKSLEQLDLLLLTVVKPRKVRRDGIHFQGLRYIDPVLASYVNENVIIRYDPSDITELRVFYKNKYLCRPVCQDLATQKVSLKEIQKARNDRKKDLDDQIKQRISLIDAVLKSKKPKVLETIKSEEQFNENKSKLKLKLYEVDA